MPVSVVVEDGSGVEGANSYLSAAAFEEYADARAYSYGADEDAIASALIRATAWLDNTYRARWPGSKANGREQATAWPRRNAEDQDGEEISDDEIPQEVVDASAEAAWRELQSPGSLSPDLERGGAIKSLKAGSVEVVYADSASSSTVFTTIETMLDGLLTERPGNTSVTFPMRA